MITQIGKYKIERELASGGFGRVYRGLDEAVGRPVAVKVLTAAADESTLARFGQEAAAAGNLHHANIVTLYEFGNHEGTPFLAMEYLEGKNLQQLIDGKAPLSMLEKLRILRQVAEGLEHAHRSGVVHRDIKPSNIMILPDGVVKIMDFGIARVARQSGMRLTHTGDLIGTLLYMSPEQFRNTESDAVSDIFAVGIVAYELISGVHPFYADDTAALMYRVTNEEPKPVCQGVPDCPPELDGILRRALAKDRHLRYQSLRDLIYDLEPLVRVREQQEADRLLGRAQALYASGDLSGAEGILGEVLALNAANATARSLRATILMEELQTRLAAAIGRGKEHMSAQRWREAAEEFGLAARLGDPSGEAALQLAAARNEMERVQRAAALLEEARRLFSQGDSARALPLAERAALLDSEANDVASFLEEVRQAQAQKEATAGFRSAVTKARGLSLIGELDRAAALLDELPQDFAQDNSVVQLRARMAKLRQAQAQRGEAEAVLNAVRGLIHEERLEEALAMLESPAPAEPHTAAERGHLLRSIRQKLEELRLRRQREQIAAEVNADLAKDDFDGASQKLDAALRADPGDAEWGALLQLAIANRTAAQDGAECQAHCAECDVIASRGEVEQAIGKAEAASLRWPESQATALLLQRLRPIYDSFLRERQTQTFMQWAREQNGFNRPFVAIGLLEAALVLSPGYLEATALLEQIKREMVSSGGADEAIQKEPAISVPDVKPEPPLFSALLGSDLAIEASPANGNLLARATNIIRGFFR